MSKRALAEDGAVDVAKLLIAFETEMDLTYPSKLSGQRFRDYAWDEFQPKVILSFLTQQDFTYFAHKEILFSGLCGWMVAPHTPNISKNLMVLAAAAAIARLERKATKQVPDNQLVADIARPFLMKGLDFYRDFYTPIGGFARIANAPTLASAKKVLGNRLKAVRVANLFVKLNHHHAVLSSKHHNYRIFSKDACTKVIQSCSKELGTGERRTLERSVNPLAISVPLTYAADSVSVAEGVTLLDAICSGKLSVARYGSQIPQWLGRARFVRDELLAHAFKTRGGPKQYDYLTDFAPIPFDPPHVSDSIIAAIKAEFGPREPVS